MAYFERLKAVLPHLRERKGLTQKQVAEKLDIGVRMYQRIEQTGRATIDNIVKLGEILDATIADLTEEPSGIKLYKVPLITRIPASGFRLGFEDVQVEDWIYTTVSAAGAFALKAHGDSMSPKIEDGDVIIVAPDQPFENNKIYAVIAGESEHTLKTVKRIEGGYLLVPFNQNYDTLFVPEPKLIKLYKALNVVKAL